MLPAQCDRAHQWVSLELDGELSEFELTLLEAHVGRCDACRSFRADTHAITGALRRAHLEPILTPVSVTPRRRRSFRLAPAAAAAAAVAVALGSVFSSLELRNTFTSSGPQPAAAKDLDVSINKLRLSALEPASPLSARSRTRSLAGGPAVPRDAAARRAGR
jgi:anti-sigma factor RsiW